MTKTNKMIETINEEIAYSNIILKEEGYSECYTMSMQRIYGMLAMLTIYTGKKYIITEDGIKEN